MEYSDITPLPSEMPYIRERERERWLSVCPCISSNYDTIGRENKQLVVHSVTSPLALLSSFVVKCYCTLDAFFFCLSPPPKSIFLLLDFLKLLIFVDFKKELRSLNRELQLHILEFADVLVERPSQYARRVEEISLIFKNLHHLLNSSRPQQVNHSRLFVIISFGWFSRIYFIIYCPFAYRLEQH